MVRTHLPAAMQGMAVVPIFAGFDTARGTGRLFQYDVTGGRYEESDHAATGSGSMHATTVVKLGWREGLDARRHRRPGPPGAVGGRGRGLGHRRTRPDPRHLPVVATITADGFDRLRTTSSPSATQRSSSDSPPIEERLGHEHAPALRPPTTRPYGRNAHSLAGGSVMSMPFYVAPEQVMKDRADYARKGIARGRSLVAATFDDGILLCAENPSRMLRKVSEIYDRIGFAGVGKYNEFDQLRIAGVRHADLKGFSFSREDVDARSLANQYAQMLGQVFTHEMKPMEVEILVAEVGVDRAATSCSTSSTTAPSSTRRAGPSWAARPRPSANAWARLDAGETLASTLGAAGHGPGRSGAHPGGGELEVAVLERGNGRRAFRRLDDDEVGPLLSE